ncbi:EAL domain-containing protein [Pengzhenrongella sicca]|uniref:EAL domain-containing protein n=1 Tax=Pengzhenrongella sicca TaxID=2819238 RepID=A0A8A4ZHA8_9MICO|nr:EAL domain-containing protein [Pengzhenrongella sicca]
MAHLQRLPVRRVKTDRSLVGRVATDREGDALVRSCARALVRSTIDLARTVGLVVVAEGGLRSLRSNLHIHAEGSARAWGKVIVLIN